MRKKQSAVRHIVPNETGDGSEIVSPSDLSLSGGLSPSEPGDGAQVSHNSPDQSPDNVNDGPKSEDVGEGKSHEPISIQKGSPAEVENSLHKSDAPEASSIENIPDPNRHDTVELRISENAPDSTSAPQIKGFDSDCNLSHNKFDQPEILPQDYQLNELGVGHLPDGTIVIQPKPVDEDDKVPHSTRSQSKNGHVSTNGANSRKGSTESLGKAFPASTRSSARSSTSNRSLNLMEPAKCTRCWETVELLKGEVHVHPSLEVLICKRCYQTYMSNRMFEKDPSDGKDSQCRWCVGYGDLFCCDVCTNSFCRRCIKRNLGRGTLSYLQGLSENDTWRCYVCEPAPLEPLKDQCRKVLETLGLTKHDVKQSISRSQRSTNSSETKSDVVLLDDSDSLDSDITPSRDGSEALLAPPISNGLTSNNSAVTLRVSKTPLNGIIPSGSVMGEDSNSQSSIATLLTQLHSRLFKKPESGSSSSTKTTSLALDVPPANNRPPNPPTSSPRSTSPTKQDTSKKTSQTSFSDTINLDDDDNVTFTQALKWLDDPTQLKPTNLARFVDASLRSVAQFYQDLRRLQMSMQKEDNELKRNEYVTTFKDTFKTNIRDRLFKLPHRMSETIPPPVITTQSSLAAPTSQTVTSTISASIRPSRPYISRVRPIPATSSSVPPPNISLPLSTSSVTPGYTSRAVNPRLTYRPPNPQTSKPSPGYTLMRPSALSNSNDVTNQSALTTTTVTPSSMSSAGMRSQMPLSQRIAPAQSISSNNNLSQNAPRSVVGITNGRLSIKATAKRTFTIDLTDDDDEPSAVKARKTAMPITVSAAKVSSLPPTATVSLSQTSVNGPLPNSLIPSSNNNSLIAATMVPIIMDPMMASSFPVLANPNPGTLPPLVNHRKEFPDQRVLLTSQNFSITPRTPEISHVVSMKENPPHSPSNDSENSIDLGVSTIQEDDSLF